MSNKSDDELFDLIYGPVQFEHENTLGNLKIKFYSIYIYILLYFNLLIFLFIYN